MEKNSNKKALGNWGETVAAEYLKEQGYRVVTANYRCPYGEADLICKDQQVWCFIEVKTRRSQSSFGSGYYAVNYEKQRRITKIALYYLSKHELGEPPVRFDVVSIDYTSPDDYRVTLMKNAFF